jgi:translation initiation factor IF-1
MNKNLAILGHPTRGREVIEILEMLGGHNYSSGLLGKAKFYYYIGNYNSISYISKEKLSDSFITFTLEEFLAKFPYKVRDKVLINAGEDVCTIKSMTWDKKNGRVAYKIKEINGILENKDFWFANEIEPYLEQREETVVDTIKESKDRYRLHINYQYDIEVDEGEYYAVRRKPQYPKTYEECCDILCIETNRIIEDDDCLGYRDKTPYDINLLTQLRYFRKLIICRDTYWKIAGEQMGLGKPWKPDYTEESYEQGSPTKYVIYYTGTYITKGVKCTPSHILAFPTEEIRNIFYNNFKNTIEKCKELL